MRVNTVSPWYPDYAHPYSGIFVQKQVEAVRAQGVEVSMEVPQVFPAPAGEVPAGVTAAILELAERDSGAMYPGEGDVTYIPVPVPSGIGPLGRAAAFATAMELKRRSIPVDADLTHAHLGIPTAWAVSSLGDQPLVVTEHQSTLPGVLAVPEAREAYHDLIDRSAAFICVSPVLEEILVGALGAGAAKKVEVIPNVVDVSGLEFKERAEYGFRSWIYIGGLHIHKGVRELMRAFKAYKRHHVPDARLTVVGEGPLRAWAVRFTERNGLVDSVRFTGARPHSEIRLFLESADVLVHLSHFETFGIASLEALASGLPVVSLRNGGAEHTWGRFADRCGLLLDKGSSPRHIAEAIAELRDRPGDLDLRQARADIERRYSPHTVGNALRAVYERVGAS